MSVDLKLKKMINKVYKFGGASVKDANAVRNLKNILEKENRAVTLICLRAITGFVQDPRAVTCQGL